MPHIYRAYCPSCGITGNRAVIDQPERVHHIRDVLRMKPKDTLLIFDEAGKEYDCIIESCGSNAIVLTVTGRNERFESGSLLAVACALPKKAAMDDIVDSLTQLGVDRIIPMITERTVVRPDKASLARKFQRWQKISLSSSQQCGRTRLPLLENVCSLPDVLSMTSGYGTKLIPTLEGRRRHVGEFAGLARDPGKLVFLIGPEGDFSPCEVEEAVRCGFIPVSLGRLTLRVDTAAVAVSALFHLCADNFR
ncbi:MAG: RsmE family RNA methyltransferase [Candidatus Omnitrophota bacterium]|jgi:16S rRNA (uracil1498-N3)-methyltransferase